MGKSNSSLVGTQNNLLYVRDADDDEINLLTEKFDKIVIILQNFTILVSSLVVLVLYNKNVSKIGLLKEMDLHL